MRTTLLQRLSHGSMSIASYVVLLASLIGLIAAILVSLGDAQRLFDGAAEAQRQVAIVSRINALATADRLDGPAFDRTLRDYRRSIDAEGKALGAGSRGQQASEMRDADRIANLVRSDRMTLTALVASIVNREQAEAAALADRMANLRQRVGILVVLLAIAAALAAGFGAMGLLTANRRLERQVTERTADLAAVDRSRRLFFAKASHELRSPVTVMRGDAEIALADTGAGIDQLRGALRHIVASADFLGHRIEELLGLAQAEDGKIKLNIAPIDLAVVAARAAAAAGPYAGSAGIGLTQDLTSLPIAGDARWLGQAMVAVIENAVKFSHGGELVRISVARSDDGAAITIADRGIGVGAAELPRIFDAYYQTDAGLQRGGTGLGLALARWVVEQHRGTIRATNDPAGGCIVTMTLPVAA